jgi:predicted MFS family arabinose efflux permease
LGVLGVAWAVGFFYWFRDRPEDKATVNAAEVALIRAEAAGAGSVYDDKSHQHVPWRLLVCSVNLWAIYLAAAAVSFSWYFNVTFLPKYLKDIYHVDYKESWRITMWPLLVSACFCFLGGVGSDYLVRRTGSRRWGRSLPGLVGFTLAGFFVLVAQAMPTATTFIVLVCIACALQDLAIPCIWSVSADVGGRYAGTVSGYMNTVGGVGGTLGILVIPALAEHYGMPMVLVVNAAVYVFGGLLWLRIDATKTLLQAKGQDT